MMNDLEKAARQVLAALKGADRVPPRLYWVGRAIVALESALAQQAEPVAEPVRYWQWRVQPEPVGWLQAIDEAMTVHECGVADPADDYETAKGKLNTLLCIV